MDLKKLEKSILSLSKLEATDLVDAVKAIMTELKDEFVKKENELFDAKDKLAELNEQIDNSDASKLDAKLAVAQKEIAELQKKLGLKGDKDTRKTYLAKNLMTEPNCLHFPEGRMLVIPVGASKEITFEERNCDYYKSFEKMKFVETLDQTKKK